MPDVLVACASCNKTFLKSPHRVNENKKLGHRFYCSLQCQSSFKNKHKVVICQNEDCARQFSKSLNQMSLYNFCSRSCAAIVNNKKFPKRVARRGNCLYCKIQIKGRNRYCSIKCWTKENKITKEIIISTLKKRAQELGRSPTKRESPHVDATYNLFGSWTNAIVAAGLIPNRSLNQRMYKRRVCVATDGHKCNSVSELIIDNWLSEHNISHIKEPRYPEGNFLADWMIGSRVLVEYLGLEKDSKRYDATTQRKRKICKKFRLELLEVRSRDIFPKNNLATIFAPYK